MTDKVKEEKKPIIEYITYFLIGGIIVAMFFLVSGIIPSNNDKQTSVLDDELWSPRAQCAEFNSVYKISDEDWNCPLEPCVRLNTTSGTLVDKCTCTWNNHTVYRYCRTMLTFYDYVGGLNETNLLAVN